MFNMNFSASDHGQNIRNNKNLLVFNLQDYEELDDFANVCRICANITSQVSPIFDEQSQRDNLAGKINKYLPIEVSFEDGLPQVICEQCQNTLLAWDELVTCCIQATALLQEKLSAMRQLDPDKTKEERTESTGSPIPTGQTLICVKIENDSIDKNTELDKLCSQEKVSIGKPQKIVTKDGKRYGFCDTCNKNIAIASWRRHSQSHSTVKRYSCHICGLGFNDSSNLSRHRKAIHAEYRPHACNICHKSFTRNCHLEEHIKTHSENRDYICDMCGKASKSSAALRMHRKIHTSEYRFRCIYCESKFKRRSELLVHVLVHTGEKSHVCGCGKAFRLRSQLGHHTRSHMKEITADTENRELD